MTIKHRGNTSAYHYANKPFKVKLEKKADLITSPEDDGKDRRSKHWVLLNCSFSIRSYFIEQLGRMIGMEYVPRVEYVNVIVNDDYRGIYILSENITRDKDCRIDVDKDEGYIIEQNAFTLSILHRVQRTAHRAFYFIHLLPFMGCLNAHKGSVYRHLRRLYPAK